MKAGDLVKTLHGFHRGQIGVVTRIEKSFFDLPDEPEIFVFYSSQEIVHHVDCGYMFEVLNESR